MRVNKKSIFMFMIGTLVLVLMVSTVYGSFFRSYTTESKVNELINIIDTYYDGEYDRDEMIENMYRGLIEGVGDDYTSYMDPAAYTRFNESTQGSYAGIGTTVTYDTTDNKITIATPFPNSPSEKAGLKPGDKILKVNGVDVYGDKLDEAITLMKGEPGTTVNVQILYKLSGKIEDLEIVRAKIDIPTIESEMLEDNTGYIRITNFDQVTTDQYFTAYNELEDKGMEKLIIDVRDNPGGLLSVVSEIADSILPEGIIVYTEDKNGKRDYKYSDKEQIEIPLVVLVNEYSASASEVLAEAIKDHEVGVIVGEKTYGKGCVQNLITLRDGSAIKVTIAKYYSPNGYSIHEVGLEPNVEIEFDETVNGSSFGLTFEEDEQLQKAFEVVNNIK